MVIQTTRQYSRQEFERFIERSENRDRLFELINGEIVEKVAGFKPSKVGTTIIRRIGNYLDTNDIGHLTGADGSYILSDEHHFMPDVAYISRERLPEEPEGMIEGPPDLAIEVKSPSNSVRELRLKAEDYLRFGAQMVWLIFPESRTAEVYVPDDDVILVDIAGVLDGGDVLPGFKLPLREVFKK